MHSLHVEKAGVQIQYVKASRRRGMSSSMLLVSARRDSGCGLYQKGEGHRWVGVRRSNC
jgi:hypothetical protein